MKLIDYRLSLYSLQKIFDVLKNDGFDFNLIQKNLHSSKLISFDIEDISLNYKIQFESMVPSCKHFIRTNKFVILITVDDNSTLDISFVNHDMFFLIQELNNEDISHIQTSFLDRYFNSYEY